jgi:hypothetical protein
VALVAVAGKLLALEAISCAAEMKAEPAAEQALLLPGKIERKTRRLHPL